MITEDQSISLSSPECCAFYEESMFQTLSNIFDRDFFKNNLQVLVIEYFRKKTLSLIFDRV